MYCMLYTVLHRCIVHQRALLLTITHSVMQCRGANHESRLWRSHAKSRLGVVRRGYLVPGVAAGSQVVRDVGGTRKAAYADVERTRRGGAHLLRHGRQQRRRGHRRGVLNLDPRVRLVVVCEALDVNRLPRTRRDVGLDDNPLQGPGADHVACPLELYSHVKINKYKTIVPPEPTHTHTPQTRRRTVDGIS